MIFNKIEEENEDYLERFKELMPNQDNIPMEKNLISGIAPTFGGIRTPNSLGPIFEPTLQDIFSFTLGQQRSLGDLFGVYSDDPIGSMPVDESEEIASDSIFSPYSVTEPSV